MKTSRILIAAALLTTSALAADLERFTPLGLATEVRQVQARFNADMAPLGKPDAAPPFIVDCVPGNGYWADSRTWVYDLSATPAPSTSCRFTPVSGLKSLAGEAVITAAEYQFHMAGPKVVKTLPAPGLQIDEFQAFVLQLDGPVSPASITENVHCAVQGIHERIPVKRLIDKSRQSVLELAHIQDELSGVTENQIEIVRCERPLPANAKISLVWSQGIYSASGLPNSTDQSFNFQVRDHFSARMRCTRENARAGCMPLKPVRLEFTAQVARALLDRITLKDASGKSFPQQRETDPFDTDITFPGPFPSNTKLSLTLPGDLQDDAKRDLVNQSRFPLSVGIDDMPPLLKFSGEFGIIERQTGGLLPITLRNLEPGPDGTAAKLRYLRLDSDADITAWWQRLHDFDNPREYPRPDKRKERLLDAKLTGLVERTLPKPNGANAFEVVGLPLAKPGYYVIEAESRRLGQSLLASDAPMYVRAAALVTNLAVHFKWGPKSSLAWVTSLDKGLPVAQARIAVSDCKGKLLAKAVTDAKGMGLIPAGLPDPRSQDYECPLLVSARAGDDVSFARSDWEEGIETWRFNMPADWEQEDRLAHTVLDRTLLRPGETVHMRHIVRDKRLVGLGFPSKTPKTLKIEHDGSGQRWFLPIDWKGGAAVNDWAIPSTAKRGGYTLRLIDKEIKPDTPASELESLPGLDSGAFSVGDFRVPLMKASLDPRKDRLVGDDHAEFNVAVGYLNGGAAKNMDVKLRGQLSPRWQIHLDDWPDYDFARQADDAPANAESSEDITLSAEPFKLDAGGAGRGRLAGLPIRSQPQTLRVELEYTDPNGEIQTVSKTQRWWPAEVVLGFKRPDWVKAGQSTTLQFLAVDTAGKPLAGVPIQVKPSLRQTNSYRQRLAGGFYAYREETRNTELASQCEGRSDAKGQYSCTVTSPESGELIVAAEAKDSAGRLARTHASLWVAGEGEWWFEQDNHDRIDLIPEKATYQAGEKARFQVRMPFREATALITVERDGILDARVVTLSGKAPVFELPVQASWAPNIFVSALAVRGRVDTPPATALVDLGKPAFKLGIASIKVDQRGHRLDVQVKSERDTYQTRDKAKVRIAVKSADGKPLPADAGIIVAAVDEGLLELADNKSWDLLPAMMAERGYNMRTFTAQMQVTGKRHFGKKALPAGGGGGRSATRELFDTLLYWNPALSLDAKGEANVEIPLNDSLTRFRIVAVAVSENRFGTGWTAIRATRDLQIASGLAPVIRQGDRFEAKFTVRNSTQRAMKIAVGGQATGLPPLPSRSLELGPGDGKEVAWTIDVPAQATHLAWYVNAREVGGSTQDAVKVSQAVEPAVPVRLVAGQLYRLDKPLDLPLAPPTDALPGQGEVRATLAATLGDGLSGVREYMRRYPFACLEQKTSKAIATKDTKAWAELVEALPGYLDSDGLAAFFPGLTQGDVALTAYLLAVSQEAGWTLPADARAQMETALENFVAGRIEMPANAWRTDQTSTALRLTALDALSRAGRANAELIATVKPEPHAWTTGMLIDWLSILKRSTQLPNRDTELKAAEAALRSRTSYTGQRLNFGDNRDGQWWMMRSADSNAVRGLLAVLDLPGWKNDIPKLVSGALARQSRGHWDTTTANAWGSLALDQHGKLFDSVKPAGLSNASLGQEARQVDWKAFPSGATASFPLPTQPATLKLRHQGSGAPYVTLATLAAIDLKQPVARGYAIQRELIPIEQKTAGKWSKGDIVRVRLNIDARDDMGWVVVEDPVPAGASLLGSGTKRDSAILTGGEQQTGQAWPAWQERRFEVFRAYYDYVPRGRFSLEYTLRLNTEGRYNLPASRVEAMYAPEMYGEAPNADFVVGP